MNGSNLQTVDLPSRLFVTGTDTNVGKTVVSAILTKGLDAFYWKPVQSGIADGTDSVWLQQSTGCDNFRIYPERYRLNEPLSPHAAARIDGVEIELTDFSLPGNENDSLIVEGAGGTLVPLNDNALMIDLMQHLALPVLVVARSGLGTINHTLLTLRQLRAQSIPVCGVVMNGPKNESNRQAIEHYGQVAVIAEIEYLSSFTPATLQGAFDSFYCRTTRKLASAK